MRGVPPSVSLGAAVLFVNAGALVLLTFVWPSLLGRDAFAVLAAIGLLGMRVSLAGWTVRHLYRKPAV